MAAGEAEARMGPEGVALVDELDRPAGVQVLEVFVQGLVQEEPVDLGGLRRGGIAPAVDAGRQAAQGREDIVGIDVDQLAVDPATVARPRRQELHLGAACHDRVDELADVGRRAVRARRGDAAVGGDVGDAHAMRAPRRPGGAAPGR